MPAIVPALPRLNSSLVQGDGIRRSRRGQENEIGTIRELLDQSEGATVKGHGALKVTDGEVDMAEAAECAHRLSRLTKCYSAIHLTSKGKSLRGWRVSQPHNTTCHQWEGPKRTYANPQGRQKSRAPRVRTMPLSIEELDILIAEDTVNNA